MLVVRLGVRTLHLMQEFFGARWGSPAFEDAVEVAVPVGRPCLLCGALLVASDRGCFQGCVRMVDGEPVGSIEPTHLGCHLRAVLGNVHHLSGRCRHVGGCNEVERDSLFEQGQAVLAYLEQRHRRQRRLEWT